MKKNSKITIIGTGAMGTALGKVIYDSGYENIFFYGIDEVEINELKKGINTKYFPNSTDLPKFKASSKINECLEDANYILLAVPSKTMDLVFAKVLGSISSDVIIINASKGFFPGTKLSLHEGLEKKAANIEKIKGVVSLLGPSHAEEIAQALQTIVAIVSRNIEIAKEVQDLFKNKYFKTYVQTDIKGAEAGAAYKNILAIAAGVAEGMGCGINARAALLTRGMYEMQKYNKAVKGKKETIWGLTGLGDLIVTATSVLSRNYVFGMSLAKKGSQKASKTNVTVEGLTALEHVHELMLNKKLELPIVDALYKLVHNRIDKEKALKLIWDRKLKSE